MKVLQFPLTKITIGFVLGLLISFYGKPQTEFAFVLLFISFTTFGFFFIRAKRDFDQKLYFGLALFFLSFSIGITTQVVHTDFFQKNNYMHQVGSSDEDHLVELVLREKLKSSAFSNRYIAVVKRMDSKISSGRIIVNFYKSELTDKLIIGSLLQIQGAVLKHQPIKNPNQFDYGQYLIHKSILAQMYVSANEVKINKQTATDIWYYSDQLRNRILENLRKSGFAEEELHVVAALILGQQQDISPEILHDYQFAGAIHVLSVSGLHVGYLLVILNFLLQFLPKNKFNSYLKLSIILFSLWGFAILAGLSPSVVRSVTMFSFVTVGMHLKRKTNIFHTLLASAFFILLFQPAFLFDVGFQLSYVSLFFILWLQPLFSRIWLPKNKVQTYFWDIVTVSFAAQIGVLPLSIYYFHQFPGLFFLTNLIILPGLGLIMGLGVVVMVLAVFNYVPFYLSKVLEGSIAILDRIINWVASFEQFIIQDIPLNWYLMISLYVLILSVFIWFSKPNFMKIMAVLIAILIFQITYFGTQLYIKTQKEFIVFNVKKSSLIGERMGNKVTLYSPKKFEGSPMLKSYLVANFCDTPSLKTMRNTFYFQNKKILILDSSGVYLQNCKPDILVITKSPKINLERLLQKLHPVTVVADASNYKTYIKIWKATCQKQKIPFHATGEKGFYRLE